MGDKLTYTPGPGSVAGRLTGRTVWTPETGWTDDAPMECGFCGGRAIRDEDGTGWMHADHGDRVTPSGPGDMVSARHNVAGSTVLAVDLVEVEQ